MPGMNMGRPLEFDPERVVDQSMHLFWSQGYDATSLQDLLRTTGLSKSSLYQAFHSKQKLFDRCIDRYLDSLAGKMLGQLADCRSGRQFIEHTFQAVIGHADAAEADRGCLLWNATVEFGQRDATVAKRLGQGMDRLAGVFETAVRRAQEEGDISPQKNPKVLSLYLLSSMSGLRSMLKGGIGAQKIKGVVQVILASLD